MARGREGPTDGPETDMRPETMEEEDDGPATEGADTTMGTVEVGEGGRVTTRVGRDGRSEKVDRAGADTGGLGRSKSDNDTLEDEFVSLLVEWCLERWVNVIDVAPGDTGMSGGAASDDVEGPKVELR